MKTTRIIRFELEKAERCLARARKALEPAGMVEPAALLTPLQYEIAKLVVDGMSEKEVARALSPCPKQ